VIVCFDADKAGIAASERAFRELVQEGLSVRVASLTAGDDPDSFINRNGPDAFRELLDGARDFFDFKLEFAKSAGALDTAAGRAAALTDCASALMLMSDFAARENQINVVATHLQTSANALREAIAKLKSRPQRAARETAAMDSQQEAPVEPTPLHRIVAFLCHLALGSAAAQHLLGEQFETLHEASRWLEGIPLLETILSAQPDPTSPAAVNAFLATLPESDRLALMRDAVIEGAPVDGMQAAEHALSLLSGVVLQRRDAAVKAALKEPGLSSERMFELLEEAKEIKNLLRGIDQRCHFDDELPKSTYKPKEPEWKKRWRDRT
jgi:DNA primase